MAYAATGATGLGSVLVDKDNDVPHDGGCRVQMSGGDATTLTRAITADGTALIGSSACKSSLRVDVGPTRNPDDIGRWGPFVLRVPVLKPDGPETSMVEYFEHTRIGTVVFARSLFGAVAICNDKRWPVLGDGWVTSDYARSEWRKEVATVELKNTVRPSHTQIYPLANLFTPKRQRMPGVTVYTAQSAQADGSVHCIEILQPCVFPPLRDSLFPAKPSSLLLGDRTRAVTSGVPRPQHVAGHSASLE